jgi:hypothetical protein
MDGQIANVVLHYKGHIPVLIFIAVLSTVNSSQILTKKYMLQIFFFELENSKKKKKKKGVREGVRERER